MALATGPSNVPMTRPEEAMAIHHTSHYHSTCWTQLNKSTPISVMTLGILHVGAVTG